MLNSSDFSQSVSLNRCLSMIVWRVHRKYWNVVLDCQSLKRMCHKYCIGKHWILHRYRWRSNGDCCNVQTWKAWHFFQTFQYYFRASSRNSCPSTKSISFRINFSCNKSSVFEISFLWSPWSYWEFLCSQKLRRRFKISEVSSSNLSLPCECRGSALEKMRLPL